MDVNKFSGRINSWKEIDKADGKVDGLVQKSALKNLDINLLENLNTEDKNLLEKLEQGKIEQINLSFIENHENDITFISATRPGENAVTWLSQEFMKNWKPGESIDEAIKKVSELSRTGKTTHHPSTFSSKSEHEPVKSHHSLIFANSDYNADGKLTTGDFSNDLKDVDAEGKDLLKTYQSHKYQANLFENQTDNQILNQIENKITQLEPGDELVIHYSGHGQSSGINGINTILGELIPSVDNVINSEILNLVSKAKAKGIKVVVLLDSCESGFTTDYVRDKQIKGLDKLIDSLNPVTSNEKELIGQAKSNFNKITNLQEEIDNLSKKNISLEIEGKKYSFPFNKAQNNITKIHEKLISSENISAETKLLLGKSSIDLQLLNLNYEKSILEIYLKFDTDPKKLPEINAKISELDKKIIPLKEQQKKLETEVQKLKNKTSQGEKNFKSVISEVENVNQQILSKEKELNQLLAQTYSDLAQVNGYNPANIDIGPKKWGFATTALYSPATGPGVQMDVKYNLLEFNRFSSVGMKFSGGVGTTGLRTVEALTYDIDKNWGIETGLSQNLGYDKDFTSRLHLGGTYKINDTFHITGGIDASEKPETFLDRLNPYIGLSYNFK